MREYCEELIKCGVMAKQELITDIQYNPVNAIEWVEKDLKSIIMGRFASRVLIDLNGGKNPEQILEHLRIEVMKNAQFINSSTSKFANHVKDIENMMMAQFVVHASSYIKLN